jgi:hypothetical protein
MRVYIGFDDTDNVGANRGTGKVARWFEDKLPEECHLWGVVRQQLLRHESIAYTSHNSAACLVVDMADSSLLDVVIARATDHLESNSLEGSDPGLCVAGECNGKLAELIVFGHMCTRTVVTQQEALDATAKVHLTGHGGTNDGIIGAAAAVGLTASGWCGRLIEFGRLRDFPDIVRVSDLESSDIFVVSLDRDARVPAPDDLVLTKGWLRPRLWGNRAVVGVVPNGNGTWESLGERRRKAPRE